MLASKINKNSSHDMNSFTYFPIVIVGAGVSGIAMGCRLREVIQFDQFRIFDRQSEIGGTWWINRYPGVACDIPAIFYSFSFAQNPNWTVFHPTGPEIVRYLQDVCEDYGITDKIQLNTEVKECVWDKSNGVWDITLCHLSTGLGDLSTRERQQRIDLHGYKHVFLRDEKIKAKILVSAVGGLVEPNPWPYHIPGKELFRGDIFHSARWRHDVDLKDKDVIVIGTGCSAAQFVPKLTTEYGAKSVTQIMRSPPWVEPLLVHPMGEIWWKEWGPWLCKNIPGHQQILRIIMAAGGEWDWRLFGVGEWHKKHRAAVEIRLLDRMKKLVLERYWEMLTPNYSVGCKRRIYDTAWLTSLNEPNIELTTLPLQEVHENSVTLGPRRIYPDPNDTSSLVPNHPITIPADVIVLANGYNVGKWFHPLKIVGREGKTLQDIFDERGGPQLYMGAAMDGFPNFFAIFGPNLTSGHSSVILAVENVINLSIKFIGPILKGEVSEVEIKKEAEVAWTDDIQRACKETVWHQGGCRNWYREENDWNSVTYPYSQIHFTLRCMFPTYKDWSIIYTKKGLLKRRIWSTIRYIVYSLAVVSIVYSLVGIYEFSRSEHDIQHSAGSAWSSLKLVFLMGARSFQRIAGVL